LLDTLRLGGELDPAEMGSAWRRVDTRGLSGLVMQEGCALWLYRRLRSAGAELAPQPAFAAWLSQRARDDAARNLLIDARVSQLSEWLTGQGYPHVWLKGAARRLAAATYPYADARATNDVDVIVPAELVRGAWEQLGHLGFERACAPELTPPNHFHLPPLSGADRVAVELHLSTSTQVGPEEAWRRATDGSEMVRRGGIGFAVPSATELLWHSIAHGLHHGTAGFRLRYFQDASVILAAGRPIDWRVIGARLDSPEVPSRALALAWLGAAALLSGRPLPPEMSAVTSFQLGRALRWRLTVSRHVSGHPRAAEKLVEEGSRAEIGWPILKGVQRTSTAVRIRRRLAAVAARGVYRAWRML
jgi:Uncharacterised nucleotidyltransferase